MQKNLILYLQMTFSAMTKDTLAFQLSNGKYKFPEYESAIALLCLMCEGL